MDCGIVGSPRTGLAMAAQSAGILLYKRREGRLVVLLVHPGGPFWRAKDLGAWSIPKGEPMAGEEPEATARREFAEELGSAPSGALHPLGKIRQRGGNSFEVEWPPRSGRLQSFPEVDRAEWFELPEARRRILVGQQPLLDRLEEFLGAAARGCDGRGD